MGKEIKGNMANTVCKYCFRDEENDIYEKPLLHIVEKCFGREIDLVLDINTETKKISLEEINDGLWEKQIKIKYCPMCGRNLNK